MDNIHFLPFIERFITPEHYEIAKKYSLEFSKEESLIDSVETTDIINRLAWAQLYHEMSGTSSSLSGLCVNLLNDASSDKFAVERSSVSQEQLEDMADRHSKIRDDMGKISTGMDDTVTFLIMRYEQIATYAMELAGNRNPAIVNPQLENEEFRYEVTRNAFGTCEHAVRFFDMYQQFAGDLGSTMEHVSELLKNMTKTNIYKIDKEKRIKKMQRQRDARIKLYKKIFSVT